MSDPISLYVHIPFCETKCPYCDFNTYSGIEPLMPAYVASLEAEVRSWGEVLGRIPIQTVFFGGGTPSYLPAADIGSLLECVAETFDTGPLTEVTLESNPGDLDEAKVAAYRRLGVNRLSIGVQSFSDRLLELLGRRHTAEQAVEAYSIVTDGGFDNVSIDLMYGLPHQGLDDWTETLAVAGGLMPPHISMYCLTLEAGTPMQQRVSSGTLPEPDPDLGADMYLAAEQRFGDLGYRHYEISNWAHPGRESAHNLTYWRNGRFLGVGPGAHSYLEGYRFSNIRSPREYIARLSEATATEESRGGSPPLVGARGEPPEPISSSSPVPREKRTQAAAESPLFAQVPVVDSVDRIDRRLEMAETMMMGLRLDTGVGVREFKDRFGTPPENEFHGTLDELQSDGLLEVNGESLTLTPRGRLLGNEVFSRFFE